MRFAPLASLIAIAGLSLSALPALAVDVETNFSPAFQTKLDKDLGVREGEVLASSLEHSITHTFEARGIKAAKVVVTIDDAQPNRPTMQQITKKLGLDPIRSRGIGGAKVMGTAYDASGKEIGKYDYDWYETDIRQVIGYDTWHDAEWTFDRFATRFAKQLG